MLVLAAEVPRRHRCRLCELAGDDGIPDSVDVTLTPVFFFARVRAIFEICTGVCNGEF